MGAATDPTAADKYFAGVTAMGMEDAYKSCAVRIRYNLSTSDFPSWPEAAMEPNHPWSTKMVDSKNNSRNNDYSKTPLTQDPYIYIGTGDDASDDDTTTRTGKGSMRVFSSNTF